MKKQDYLKIAGPSTSTSPRSTPSPIVELDEGDVLHGARPGRGGRHLRPDARRKEVRHHPDHRREHQRRRLHADLRGAW
ncbi:MAG: hypothetical protein MZV65_21050 [Chromatiales bacterium]|nr:hypothetical protein [Chromatiales bacterium]